MATSPCEAEQQQTAWLLPSPIAAPQIAQRFLSTVYATYQETGRMYEKFNAEQVSSFGWLCGLVCVWEGSSACVHVSQRRLPLQQAAVVKSVLSPLFCMSIVVCSSHWMLPRLLPDRHPRRWRRVRGGGRLWMDQRRQVGKRSLWLHCLIGLPECTRALTPLSPQPPLPARPTELPPPSPPTAAVWTSCNALASAPHEASRLQWIQLLRSCLHGHTQTQSLHIQAAGTCVAHRR